MSPVMANFTCQIDRPFSAQTFGQTFWVLSMRVFLDDIDVWIHLNEQSEERKLPSLMWVGLIQSAEERPKRLSKRNFAYLTDWAGPLVFSPWTGNYAIGLPLLVRRPSDLDCSYTTSSLGSPACLPQILSCSVFIITWAIPYDKSLSLSLSLNLCVFACPSYRFCFSGEP